MTKAAFCKPVDYCSLSSPRRSPPIARRPSPADLIAAFFLLRVGEMLEAERVALGQIAQRSAFIVERFRELNKIVNEAVREIANAAQNLNLQTLVLANFVGLKQLLLLAHTRLTIGPS